MPPLLYGDDYSDLRLSEVLIAVKSFHKMIKAPVCAGPPQLLPCDPSRALSFSSRLAELACELADASSGAQDVLLSRAALAVEELSEWVAAHVAGDLNAAADAIGDRLFVLGGDAVATGLPLDLLFEEVAISNLSKLPLIQTGQGRAVKGSTYQPPDVKAALEAHALRQRPQPTPVRKLPGSGGYWLNPQNEAVVEVASSHAITMTKPTDLARLGVSQKVIEKAATLSPHSRAGADALRRLGINSGLVSVRDHGDSITVQFMAASREEEGKVLRFVLGFFERIQLQRPVVNVGNFRTRIELVMRWEDFIERARAK